MKKMWPFIFVALMFFLTTAQQYQKYQKVDIQCPKDTPDEVSLDNVKSIQCLYIGTENYVGEENFKLKYTPEKGPLKRVKKGENT